MRGFALLRAMLLAFVALAAWLAIPAQAAERIPAAANAYRGILVREARHAWGLNANVALFAAQIHQESAWNKDAQSHVGARGLTQFMPATAADMNRLHRNDLGELEIYSPLWAIRAMVLYDKAIWNGIRPRTSEAIDACSRYAMMLSGYNGGSGWVERDRTLTAKKGGNPDVWFGNVESNSTRAKWAFKENRGYPKRIIYRNLPIYLRNGWAGEQPCPPQE